MEVFDQRVEVEADRLRKTTGILLIVAVITLVLNVFIFALTVADIAYRNAP